MACRIALATARGGLLVLLAAALMENAMGANPGTPLEGELVPKAPPGETRYNVENGYIFIHNGGLYHNRPLYVNNGPGVVLAGDQPHIQFAHDPYVYGSLQIGLVREGVGRWLHHCAEVEADYRCGAMRWRIHDPRFEGVSVHLETVPMDGAVGFITRAHVWGARDGDELVWAFGGARLRRIASRPNISWELDPLGSPALLKDSLTPSDCLDNEVRIEDDRFILHPPAYPEERNIPRHTVVGWCSGGVPTVGAGRAVGEADPWAIFEPQPEGAPVACGRVPLRADTGAVFWTIQGWQGPAPGDSAPLRDAKGLFAAGQARVDRLARQVVVETPEPRLDAAVTSACAALDGVWYPPIYVHGGMLWNMPFPGWRTIYGPTAFGWHERVKEELRYYIASQTTEGGGTEPHADPGLGLGQEARDSRFHGKGRIQQHQNFYNFQTQFFDQAIHAWRWTGDPELTELLRPALELHLEWQQDCFDPDGDGTYESYINTWPTDSIWFNGGGTPEETAYAYAGHIAARDMARLAGDNEADARHTARADAIRTGFLRQLWIQEKGHPGAYREQGGHQRLHEDAWLYGIFCPIDAGMLDPFEAAQALHYTEWGLEREVMSHGGERCWTSNWLPSVWSVRELTPGDNHHLSLAHFQTGLAREGWQLLLGSMLDSAYNTAVPGNLGHHLGGTDFNDMSSMFARNVVQGLFGYRPDYPNGKVVIAPGFPEDWDHASIQTPDVHIGYVCDSGETRYRITLFRTAEVELRIPLNAKLREDPVVLGGPEGSLEDLGDRAGWKVVAGIDRTDLVVTVPAGDAEPMVLHVIVAVEPASAPEEPSCAITVPRGTGLPSALLAQTQDLLDPQGVLGKGATVMAEAGHHLLFARTLPEELPAWRRVSVLVTDRAAEEARAEMTLEAPPFDGVWTPIDLTAVLNGDVQTIFQQEYLSPRPRTCSVRIGTDGYKSWTFYYWNMQPPVPELGGVPELLHDGQLVTPQGVPFAWTGGEKNIAFTSLWDNWPERVTVPVVRSGDSAWVLVCGSTNPMQTNIANAVLRFQYVDGVEEELELVPPHNFWSLCPYGGADYNYERDAFSLPERPPATVQLGGNCRAMLLNRRLRPDVTLGSVSLECLSQEVVIGLMGVTIAE